MLEKIYDLSISDEKSIGKVIDDDILEFFVVKSPNPRNYKECNQWKEAYKL